MSGGHYNYAFHTINDLADSLGYDIENNNKENDWGMARNFSDQLIDLLNESKSFLRKASEIGRVIEWLYSDDIGEERSITDLSKLLNQ